MDSMTLQISINKLNIKMSVKIFRANKKKTKAIIKKFLLKFKNNRKKAMKNKKNLEKLPKKFKKLTKKNQLMNLLNLINLKKC